MHAAANESARQPHSALGRMPRPYWPHWCIHGELYDLEPWMATHPGGADFLRRTRGTDCSVAFEIQHIRPRCWGPMLRRYHVGPAGELHAPQFDWGPYHALRGRVAARLKELGWTPGPHRGSRRTALLALAIAAVIPWLWPMAAFDGVIASSLLGAAYVLAFFVFGGLGHIFVHQESRLSVLGDLFMLSSYEWKTTHCIDHHGYTNDPQLDGDVGVFAPIIDFAPGQSTPLQRLAPFVLLPTYALSFTIIRFQLLVELWRDPQQRARRSVLYLLGSYGWLVLWAINGHFWVGLALECVISLLFCALTMLNHNHAECHEVSPIRDFVAYQLESTRDWGSTNFWSSMVLGFFLGTQSLHHLFPTLDPHYLWIVEEELEAMGYRRPVRPVPQLLREHVRFIWRASTR